MSRDAIQKGGKKPKTLISDGAKNFHDAFRKEMWSRYGEERSPDHFEMSRELGELMKRRISPVYDFQHRGCSAPALSTNLGLVILVQNRHRFTQAGAHHPSHRKGPRVL
jgi:hypothetical protein